MVALIMEDDPTMLEKLKNRISWTDMGLDQIVTAASMPEGQRLMGENCVDFMLLDVEVIRGTGIELLRWARTHGYGAECVFLTNHEEFQYAKAALHLGSVDYVLKTEPLAAVEDATRRALARIRPDVLLNTEQDAHSGVLHKPYELKERAVQWETLLKEGKKAAMLNDIQSVLSENEVWKSAGAGYRMVLQHDIAQIVYRLLEEYAIKVETMFPCEEDTLDYRNAPSSKFAMLRWLNRFIARAISLLSAAQKKETVAEKAHAYIEEHYAEELNRQQLAELLYVSQDHLSHLFSKRYDMSLPEFIARTRVDAAKRLLKKGASVSEAASDVGYDNFTYFSTVFKKLTGLSPSEYARA